MIGNSKVDLLITPFHWASKFCSLPYTFNITPVFGIISLIIIMKH